MGVLGRPYRVTYQAKSFETGLTNIRGAVLKPDLSVAGVFTLVECPSPFQGIYYFDFITSPTDTEGEYFAVVVSPSESIKTTPARISLYLPATGGGGGSSSTIITQGIPPLVGLVASASINAYVAEPDTVLAEVEYAEILGNLGQSPEILGIVGDPAIEASL